jgi:hypothetical protein
VLQDAQIAQKELFAMLQVNNVKICADKRVQLEVNAIELQEVANLFVENAKMMNIVNFLIQTNQFA